MIDPVKSVFFFKIRKAIREFCSELSDDYHIISMYSVSNGTVSDDAILASYIA